MVFLLELKKHKQIVRSYNNPATDLPHSIKEVRNEKWRNENYKRRSSK
jgi:hypothetical protein